MKYNKIKQGEVLSSTMYLTVQKQTPDGVWVKDANGKEFEVRGKGLIESTLNSSDQYETEKKVSMTEAAYILTNAGDSVFTAVFNKADGSERTLVGRLLEAENLLGRSNVEDLLITDATKRRRQVDHRTLKSLILKGTKYTVK